MSAWPMSSVGSLCDSAKQPFMLDGRTTKRPGSQRPRNDCAEKVEREVMTQRKKQKKNLKKKINFFCIFFFFFFFFRRGLFEFALCGEIRWNTAYFGVLARRLLNEPRVFVQIFRWRSHCTRTTRNTEHTERMVSTNRNPLASVDSTLSFLKYEKFGDECLCRSDV